MGSQSECEPDPIWSPSHVFHIVLAFFGLILLLDNLAAWVPAFTFYLASTITVEILAWLIAFFGSIIIWPLLSILRPHEVKGLFCISVLLLVAITIAELALPFCGTCPY